MDVFICVEQIARCVIVTHHAVCATRTKDRNKRLISQVDSPKPQNMEKQKRVTDPKTYYHNFRLNTEQEVQLQNMMLKAGMKSKSQFFIHRIFG